MKKICLCGHFSFGENKLNGQTIKTKVVSKVLEQYFGEDETIKIDTQGGVKALIRLPFQTMRAMLVCRNIVIFPAYNGVRVLAPLLIFERKFFYRSLHYVVIGGWLPEFLKDKDKLAKKLKKFDGIYVETLTMKEALEEQGFINVEVMPNCKELKVLNEAELVKNESYPLKVCTFSRVMKEKGIEDAIEAVKAVNEYYGKIVYKLDIYGQVDNDQTEWFDSLTNHFPEYVRYGGLVPFDKSTDVLKTYYALIFPTYYNGEGFAGTLIDSMAAGVPVIASDWKYNAEIINENGTGVLFQPHDIDALKEILININESRASWEALKIDCIKHAQKYMTKNAVKILVNKIEGQ